MTLILLLCLAAPPDALPDSLPDALPDAQSSGTPADAIATAGQPIGAEAVAIVPPPAPPASPAFTVTLWTAKWCPSCQPAHKQLDELYGEGWPVQFVDYDEHQADAVKRGIALLPCYVIERDSKEVARRTGLQAKSVIIEWMRANGVRQQQAVGLPSAMPAQGCVGGVCPTIRFRGR